MPPTLQLFQHFHSIQRYRLFFAVVIGVERDGFVVGIEDSPPVVALDGGATLPVFGAKVVLERTASIAKDTAIPIPIPIIDFLFKF